MLWIFISCVLAAAAPTNGASLTVESFDEYFGGPEQHRFLTGSYGGSYGGSSYPTPYPSSTPPPSPVLVVVGDDLSKVTVAPTPAPTPAPTKEGFKMVEETVDTKAVRAPMKFDMTVEQANTPAMKLSLREGMGQATNVEVKFVEIESIAAGRRLQSAAGKAEVVFVVLSEDPAKVGQLEQTMKDKAQSGAIVGAIKSQASKNGVLVASLKAMTNVQTLQTSTVNAQFTKTTQVEDTGSGSDGLTDGAIAGIVFGVLVGVALIVVVLSFKGQGDTHPEPPQYSGGTSDSTEVQSAKGYSYNQEV
jgi:hypothetical protein